MPPKSSHSKARKKSQPMVKEPEALAYSMPLMKVENHLMKILEFLGGKNIIKKRIESELDLIGLAEEGIPKKSLDSLIQYFPMSSDVIADFLNISVRTYQRLVTKKKLDEKTSVKLIELARLLDQGEQVFGSLSNFANWMKLPILSMGGKTPLELIKTSIGLKLVLKELGLIDRAIFS